MAWPNLSGRSGLLKNHQKPVSSINGKGQSASLNISTSSCCNLLVFPIVFIYINIPFRNDGNCVIYS